jgi:NAD(P)-dependent dehydrogenase (short-subunit alcohol dehydrogenase family)
MSTPLKVFITGASSGIGLALAAEYARRGAMLGLVARRGDALAAFQQAHPQTSVSIYPADVRDAEALASAAQQFIDTVRLPRCRDRQRRYQPRCGQLVAATCGPSAKSWTSTTTGWSPPSNRSPPR